MIIKILTYICFFLLGIAVVYWFSRLQMKAWLDELNETLTKYLPKKHDHTES